MQHLMNKIKGIIKNNKRIVIGVLAILLLTPSIVIISKNIETQQKEIEQRKNLKIMAERTKEAQKQKEKRPALKPKQIPKPEPTPQEEHKEAVHSESEKLKKQLDAELQTIIDTLKQIYGNNPRTNQAIEKYVESYNDAMKRYLDKWELIINSGDPSEISKLYDDYVKEIKQILETFYNDLRR